MRETLEPGVWGVVATPFAGSTQDVDTDSLAALVEHYEAIGAVGLTVLGVFGEAASLAPEERALVLETVVESTSLPLVVGITALATRPALEEIRAARAVAGDRIAAFMVQVNSPNPDIVTGHLHAIHSATANESEHSDGGVKMVLQDYPVASGVSISTAALANVVQRSDFVVAVKAEAPPTSLAITELSAAVDISVFGGLGGQCLLDELAAGAAGAMTGFSFPEALVACVCAWRESGYDAARNALQPFLPLINFEQQARIALAVRKELLRERGFLADSAVRAPAASFPSVLRDSLRTHLAEAETALESLAVRSH
ncbi:dihydrodipicolinate synthase family protein [Arthrobacter sp. M4]|uniref:dihydrodipicolinate synthase family protein n=1 Tax=Arthrobacter sp. M4 TaxID=218160 RepID=UPI001CDCF518|nr:dihydrodipicolinate synthase family protein [Arthrobacter sp. M4]MCA4135566.1 dihydrodipicolinate synthase family protein [Arthrobacter sp. M4]